MLLLALLACTSEDSPAVDDTGFADDGCVHPLWEGAWPFPNNRLVTRGEGTATGLRVTIPEADIPFTRNDVVSLDPAWLDGLDGFSRLAPAVVQLDTPIDPTAYPALSSDETAPMFLLDLDAGQVVPGRLAITRDGTTLSVWPDRALAPATPHAIVLRADLPTGSCFSAGPALLGAEAAGDALASEMDDARTAAAALGVEAGVVVPFTTRSEAPEFATMRAIAAVVPDLVAPADVAVESAGECVDDGDSYCTDGVAWVVRGAATLPKWQDARGVFVVDGEGVPTQQGTEDVPFWLMTPTANLDAASPAPLLVLQHGLGGSRSDMVSFGRRLVAAGYAVAAIDAVQHGDRPHEDDPLLGYFGIDFTQWQVAAARDNTRQTAADHLALRQLLEEWLAESAFADIDATGAVYVGQSLGGIIGATTCAAATDIDRCVLNVPGGRLIEIVRANAAYSALMNIYFDSTEQQADIELFSALGQTIVDPADPALNARRIYADAPARSVLLQEAIHDETVLNQTTEVMARSMGIPLLLPKLEDIRGIDEAEMPVSGNIEGADGPVTAGLAQFDQEHSFLTWQEDDESDRALSQLLTFLATGEIHSGAVGE